MYVALNSSFFQYILSGIACHLSYFIPVLITPLGLLQVVLGGLGRQTWTISFQPGAEACVLLHDWQCPRHRVLQRLDIALATRPDAVVEHGSESHVEQAQILAELGLIISPVNEAQIPFQRVAREQADE